MLPKDVAGVFARPFIIGHFLPAFIALGLAALLSPPDVLPRGLSDSTSFGVQLLVIGAAALPLGLLLSNMHAHVIRMFSGEATERQRIEDALSPDEGFGLWPEDDWRHTARHRARAPLRAFKKWLAQRQARRIEVQQAKMDCWTARVQAGVPGGWAHLDHEFPHQRQRVLPTRLGNGIRAYQTYPDSRYGLDGAVIWPRIELLLSAEERSVIADATTAVAFFLNCAIASVGVALLIAFEVALGCIHAPWLAADVAGAVACFLVFRLLAVTATFRVGPPVRAAVDLHRLELYDRLGVRRPENEADENEIANAINRLLICGAALPDTVRARDPLPEREPRS